MNYERVSTLRHEYYNELTGRVIIPDRRFRLQPSRAPRDRSYATEVLALLEGDGPLRPFAFTDGQWVPVTVCYAKAHPLPPQVTPSVVERCMVWAMAGGFPPYPWGLRIHADGSLSKGDICGMQPADVVAVFLVHPEEPLGENGSLGYGWDRVFAVSETISPQERANPS